MNGEIELARCWSRIDEPCNVGSEYPITQFVGGLSKWITSGRSLKEAKDTKGGQRFAGKGKGIEGSSKRVSKELLGVRRSPLPNAR